MPMAVEPLEIPGLRLIRLTPFPDSRGLFVETFDTRAFAELGIGAGFVQDALSRSARRHTFRGLHFQSPPHAQATLVRVAQGRLLDVAVDLRGSSPTFGRHVAVELAAEDFAALYIPEGFAHGFCTLEDETEVAYKLADHYAPGHSTGIRLDDPDLGIAWPVPPESGILSDKDRVLPRLRDIAPPFP